MATAVVDGNSRFSLHTKCLPYPRLTHASNNHCQNISFVQAFICCPTIYCQKHVAPIASYIILWSERSERHEFISLQIRVDISNVFTRRGRFNLVVRLFLLSSLLYGLQRIHNCMCWQNSGTCHVYTKQISNTVFGETCKQVVFYKYSIYIQEDI